MKDLLLTQKDVADMLGVTNITIGAYKKRGIPTTDDKPSKYPARECLMWAIREGIVDFSVSNNTDLDLEELPPRERKDLADAQLKEFKLEVEKGKYLLYSDVKNESDKNVMIIRTKLLSLPKKIAPMILDADISKNEIIIKNYIYDILQEVSDD